MKIIYELDDENDEYTIEAFKYAQAFKAALYIMGNELRSESKHGREVMKTDAVYKRFFDILIEQGLNRDIVGF